jgi:hypothetical protein
MSTSNCVIDIRTPCLDDIYDLLFISQGIDAGMLLSRSRSVNLYIYAPRCRCPCQNIINGSTVINTIFIDINGNFPYSIGTSAYWYPYYYPISDNIAVCNNSNFEAIENCFFIDDFGITPTAFAVATLNLQRISYAKNIIYYSIRHDNAYNTDVGIWFFVELYADFTNNYLFLFITIITFTACRKFFTNLDIFNAKEDQQVLKGLWIGDYAYQEHHDTHIIKNAKIVDLI